MTYSRDLLAQARTLARLEPKRPKQASLRRAVSTAYYALFHGLTTDAAQAMLPGNTVRTLRVSFRRAFTHTTMRKAANAFRGGNPPNALHDGLAFQPISKDLRKIAEVFIELQEARHEADYDMSRLFTRREALDAVERAEQALSSWKSLRNTLEGKAFLVGLLLHDKIAGR